LTDQRQTELGHVERSKHHDTHVSALHQKLGIGRHLLHLAANHVKGRDNILSLSLTLVHLRLRKHFTNESLTLA
jgi:hypothetical protein